MKYLKYNLFALLLLTSFFSCDFSDENVEEDAITEATVSDLLNPAITQIAYNQSSFTGRTSALFMQYFQDNSYGNAYFNYYVPHNSTNLYWQEGLYGGSLKYIDELKAISEKDSDSDLKAIALILEVNEILHATSFYGDLPFSDALQGSDQILPKYDTQESIYEELISMIDEAIDLLGGSFTNSSLANIDVIYKGDMQGWTKLAFALKARTYLHLASKDDVNYTKVIVAVNNSFSSIQEQANFTWVLHNQVKNPMHEFNLERPVANTINENFALNLEERNDPRMASITYRETPSDYWAYQQFSPYILHWGASNTTLPLFSYVELQFMKAEALLMTGAPDQEVTNAIKLGIEASFQQMDLEPSAHLDFIDAQSSFDGLNSTDEKLSHIISEAYYSYYGYAFQQAWNNYKRLGLPDLELIGIESDINPSASLPKRYLYPEVELELNAENVKEAMERQNGGLLDEPQWIFK